MREFSHKYGLAYVRIFSIVQFQPGILIIYTLYFVHDCRLELGMCDGFDSPPIPNTDCFVQSSWAIWRDKSFLPDDILFTVNYLGILST
jgi:hypothetical protein